MYKKLKSYCLEKKGAVETYPFGPSPLVVKVGGKIFALLTEEDGIPFISLKCDPVIAENLREQNKAIRPGYHLNKQHWNTVTVDGSIPKSELYAMIDHSYELVLKGMTKAARAAIEERLVQP
ncbi:MmcQ/YjbR family DNA-binding protein [Paenibacillus sp. P96]|uniref:MmcQ/YjbR family DNA-binding protein n=1 Tax=Paenibacillus zeirhizosphaerae TaxID=2987519 RepID=A0ABT9FM28_9BACL|nr:MmcQ/YjbR family DNA-binding protein [Paenibacillus sp. P96]MDP4095591.1 MmcQ/YjbR family DNA-binding protein [Paenibacillus sp. P96]